MFKKLSILLLPIMLASCATKHELMRGTVAMKIGKSTAHVCLGSNTVKKGDIVSFYKSKCISTSDSGADRDERPIDVSCEMIKLGEGTVVKLINDHYSTIKTNTFFKFDEGTLVQKNNK